MANSTKRVDDAIADIGSKQAAVSDAVTARDAAETAVADAAAESASSRAASMTSTSCSLTVLDGSMPREPTNKDAPVPLETLPLDEIRHRVHLGVALSVLEPAGAAEDADRREHEAGADLDEGRRVALLRRGTAGSQGGGARGRAAVDDRRGEPSDSGACFLSITKRLRGPLGRRLSAPPAERPPRDSVRTGL